MEAPPAHHHALRRAGVPVGLLAAPNARPPGSLRSPSGGRTEPALQAAPVFRMAHSAPTAHRAVSFETLMLQVRFAHPPSAHRTSSSSCSGVPHGLFMISHHRPCGRWCFARLIRQAETLELQLHSQPPSKRTALSPPKRSCFRFASLTLRLRTEPALRAAPVFRSAFFSKRPCYGLFSKTLDLQVRFAHPPVGGGSSAPPCTPLSCPRKCGDRQAAIPLCGKSSLSERALDFPSALHIPRRLGPSCARRPDRRQNVQHPLAPQHPCRPRPLPLSYRSFFFSYFS